MQVGAILAAFVPLAGVIVWLSALSKDITNRNYNGIVTRGLAFAIGIGITVLYVHTHWAMSVHVDPTTTVAQLNISEQILVALVLAANAGTFADVAYRALNRADPTVAPTLVPSAAPNSLAAAVDEAQVPYAEQNAA